MNVTTTTTTTTTTSTTTSPQNGPPNMFSDAPKKGPCENSPRNMSGTTGNTRSELKAPAEVEVKPLFPPTTSSVSSLSSHSPTIQAQLLSSSSSSSASVVERECTMKYSMKGSMISPFQSPTLSLAQVSPKNPTGGNMTPLKMAMPTEKVPMRPVISAGQPQPASIGTGLMHQSQIMHNATGHVSMNQGKGKSNGINIVDVDDDDGVMYNSVEMERGEYYDWNARFKSVISLPKNTAHERLRKAVEERRLYKDFTEKATKIAKVLVKEMNAPPDRKTYKPIRRADTNSESK